MNKGSPRVVVRFPEETMERLAEVVERCNARIRPEPYTISSWIRKAVMAELAHLDRGEGTKRIELVGPKLKEVD